MLKKAVPFIRRSPLVALVRRSYLVPRRSQVENFLAREIRFTIHASRMLRTPLADFFSILLSLGLHSEAIPQTKQQCRGYVDLFLVQRPFEERLDEGDMCRKRLAEHRVALLRQPDFDAAAVAFHRVPSNEPFRHESIEDARQGALGDQRVCRKLGAGESVRVTQRRDHIEL